MTTKLAIQREVRQTLGFGISCVKSLFLSPLSLSPLSPCPCPPCPCPPCPCPLSLPLPGLPQLPSIGSAQLVKLAPPENRDSMLFCEQTCYYTIALVNTSYMLHVQLVHMLTSVTCDTSKPAGAT